VDKIVSDLARTSPHIQVSMQAFIPDSEPETENINETPVAPVETENTEKLVETVKQNMRAKRRKPRKAKKLKTDRPDAAVVSVEDSE